MDRRDFVGILATAGLAGAGAQELSAQDAPAKDVTRKLAHWIVTSKPDETTPAIRKEAARTLLNWVACAVGGSHHEALEMALSALAPFSGPAQASVLGRKERLDAGNRACGKKRCREDNAEQHQRHDDEGPDFSPSGDEIVIAFAWIDERVALIPNGKPQVW